MKQYNDLVNHVIQNGIKQDDRTGVGTLSVFGYQMRFNLQEGFPAITTKKLAWNSVVGELLWFLDGSTDERTLAELTFGKDRTELCDKKTIWTVNADNQGVALGYPNTELVKELGPIYGSQWRDFGGKVDQIMQVINEIKTNPQSRRLIVSAWNPEVLDIVSLPSCHTMFQFYVRDNKLSCQLYQRSGDIGLGIPFNIASYALLTHIIAKECNLGVGDFIHTIGDAHIYIDHMSALQTQINRKEYPLPKLKIDDNFDLMDRLLNGFELTDSKLFTLDNYIHHPEIKMQMAV